MSTSDIPAAAQNLDSHRHRDRRADHLPPTRRSGFDSLDIPAAKQSDASTDALRVGRGVRVDLHCHSVASTEADEAALIAIGCPESYSDPAEVYAQAKSRGMDLVTITDHDSIAGVARLLDRKDVFVGEELTCYFPEDHCKMHVLIWGINQTQQDALQAMAEDIYQVAAYIHEQNIAHSVAHPMYRQNDVLERWHLERLILLFKGFECLNGAHSALHRTAFEPMLDALSPKKVAEYSAAHHLAPLWPNAWQKTRTGGSDDHGLFNIGRTWTEFPPDCTTPAQILECLRTGRCQPGGEAGSSIKLAHNFYGVAVRYVGDKMASKQQSRGAARSNRMLQMLVGASRLRKRDLVSMVVRGKARSIGRKIARPFFRREETGGAAMVRGLFEQAAKERIREFPQIIGAIRGGVAPLSEHEAMFSLMDAINRDVTRGVAAAIAEGISNGELAPAFDSLSAIAAQQFLQLPYYFALFHQNREREHFPRLTGINSAPRPQALRVGWFTDDFDGDLDAPRFATSMGTQAAARNLQLTVASCAASPRSMPSWRKNFEPVVSAPAPLFPTAILALPPIAAVLEWADQKQFDVIHVDTPGPMGVLGWLAASMLRVPLVSAFHLDLPAVARAATGDFRLNQGLIAYTRWLYRQADRVLTRSHASEPRLLELGIDAGRVTALPAEFDSTAFDPGKRDGRHWHDLGIAEEHVILYRGPVTREKNLPMLAEAFATLCDARKNTALVVVGEGAYLPAMQKRLAGLPVCFNPKRRGVNAADPAVAALDYAASDLFVFPSVVETVARPVIEAQASGTPVLVADRGASAEMMDDGVSGVALPGDDPAAWAAAMEQLLVDQPRRRWMARTAPHRVTRFARPRALDALWEVYAKVVTERFDKMKVEPAPPIAARPLHSTGMEAAV